MTDNIITIFLVLLLIAIAIISGGISWWLKRSSPNFNRREWWGDFFQGISTEMVGAIVTTILFTVILGFLQQNQAIEQQKAELILQMSSPNNLIAIEAARVLWRQGWLEDGTLQDAILGDSNLKNAYLYQSDLTDTYLGNANLENANLFGATLENAWLIDTNLQGANFGRANLTGAYLFRANLSGANLLNSNLENVIWEDENAELQTATILPDGTAWTPDSDMERFTNQTHPEFSATRETINAIRNDLGLELLE